MKKVQLYDTTLRDGAQGEGMSLSVKDKLDIAKRLDQFGVHYIEGGWPSNKKDKEFFKEVQQVQIEQAKIVAFGSTRRANLKTEEDPHVKALIEAETKVITIFGKTWDLHVKEVLKTTLDENLSMIQETVSYLKKRGLEVIYDAEHFFDGFKKNKDYALKTLLAAREGGADNITLCDTNGGSLPTDIKEAIKQIRENKSLNKTPLGIHCHNDCDLAVANSITAIESGCVLVQGTINGYGERCGNANLTSIIPILMLKMGKSSLPLMNVFDLTFVSHYVSEICNKPINSYQPFIGRSAFAHKGGVHIDAMQKNIKTYEHMEPEQVGNTRRFLSSELGGRANLLVKAREFGIDLQKDSPETKRILDKVQKLENEGYQFEAAEASFHLLIQRELGKLKKPFRVKDVKVRAEEIGDNNPRATAEMKVIFEGQNKEYPVEAVGEGPVDALYNTLKKALAEKFSLINRIHLTDYKVRVVDSKAGTAAKVRVFITFRDEKEDWTTVGVDKNIIEASWKALVEAIEYKLHKV